MTASTGNRRITSLLAALLVTTIACAPTPAEHLEILSEVYSIDRVYQSMQGPSATVDVSIPSAGDGVPDLVWITGYRAEVVAPDGVTRMPPEFMCHSNLGFEDVRRHARLFGWSKLPARRLFTVSQGQADLRFPAGFGIPLLTSESLALTTQVLNHNLTDTTIQARVLVTIEYVRDQDVRGAMTPLYMKSANALVRVDDHDGHFGTPDDAGGMMEPGADAGMSASRRVIEDPFGRAFAGHWVVPPGRQENTTDVTHWMNLSRDATAHFIAVHVHPFAESLALWDQTTGDTVFVSRPERFGDRIGLARVPTLSSAEGIPLAAGDAFALTSVYDNTSAVDQEAMAVMYLYLRDDEFRHPMQP